MARRDHRPPDDAVRIPSAEGAFLTIRGLGGSAPSSAEQAASEHHPHRLARLLRLRTAATARLAAGLALTVVGFAIAFGPWPATTLLIAWLGLAFIGLVGAGFELAVLLRLRIAIAAARYERTFAAA